MMRYSAIAIILAAVLAGCVLNVRGQGPQWVGQSEAALIDKMGMPDRQMAAPSGSKVDVYQARNLHGDSMCEGNYFVRAGTIVGYSERGVAMNCSGEAGEIH